jgi:hypothetical protein
MEPNPYQSPRPGDALPERTVIHGDPILQVLTEIRDAQVELLQLNREVVKLQQDVIKRSGFFRPYTIVMMLLPLIIMAFPLYRLMTTQRPVFPTPTRRVPSPAMPPSPTSSPFR